EMRVDEIRKSLLRPDARISPGHDLVQVVLRDGGTIRGFARNRSNFDVQLQDLAGHIRPIQQREISAIREERRSDMPAVTATAEELRDLVAYLSRLTGVPPEASVAPGPEPGGIEFSRIMQAKPGD